MRFLIGRFLGETVFRAGFLAGRLGDCFPPLRRWRTGVGLRPPRKDAGERLETGFFSVGFRMGFFLVLETVFFFMLFFLVGIDFGIALSLHLRYAQGQGPRNDSAQLIRYFY